MSTYVPGTQEKDLSKVIMSLQAVGSVADIATASATTNTAAIATNTTNIAANTATLTNLAAPITNTLVADVTMNDNLFHDGPSCAQGTSGKWLATGVVTVLDTAGAATIFCKLWDGTTVAASYVAVTAAANQPASVSLSGVFSSPAGNIRISCEDSNGSPAGKIKFNFSGQSKDSTLTVIRIG